MRQCWGLDLTRRPGVSSHVLKQSPSSWKLHTRSLKGRIVLNQFSSQNNTGRRSNGCKPVMNIFRLEIRRKFLKCRGVKFWYGLQKCLPSVLFKKGSNQGCGVFSMWMCVHHVDLSTWCSYEGVGRKLDLFMRSALKHGISRLLPLAPPLPESSAGFFIGHWPKQKLGVYLGCAGASKFTKYLSSAHLVGLVAALQIWLITKLGPGRNFPRSSLH